MNEPPRTLFRNMETAGDSEARTELGHMTLHAVMYLFGVDSVRGIIVVIDERKSDIVNGLFGNRGGNVNAMPLGTKHVKNGRSRTSPRRGAMTITLADTMQRKVRTGGKTIFGNAVGCTNPEAKFRQCAKGPR